MGAGDGNERDSSPRPGGGAGGGELPVPLSTAPRIHAGSRSAEAGGYWQSMNASNRCASCSGADVSSMRGAGAVCVVPGCDGGGGVLPAVLALLWSCAAPCPPLLTLAAPLTPRGAEKEPGVYGAGPPCPGDGLGLPP